MNNYRAILMFGFAIFAMFFGSGNLVFPLAIGLNTGSNWFAGFLGLFITGILLPFLGFFVIKLHRGSYSAFFGEAGKFAQIALPLILLSLLGSFGIVPRCITVAHGGMNYVFPLPLSIFSFIFCIITFLLCLKDHLMLKILGKWMCPVLLLSLALLIIVGAIKAPEMVNEVPFEKSFRDGFLTGYQTMDLFAAFFFSSLVFLQIQDSMPKASEKETIKFAIKPSILGASLIAIIYLGLVFLGSHYVDLIKDAAPETMLGLIAKHTLGSSANFCIAVAIFLSCITTAVALNNIYARYICSLFKLKENKFPLILFITTLVSFLISLLDFKGIAKFLVPILNVSYPGVIILTILSITLKGNKKFKIYSFYIVTLAMFLYLFLK